MTLTVKASRCIESKFAETSDCQQVVLRVQLRTPSTQGVPLGVCFDSRNVQVAHMVTDDDPPGPRNVEAWSEWWYFHVEGTLWCKGELAAGLFHINKEDHQC